MEFNDLSQLFNYIERQAKESLKKDVSKQVINETQKHIRDDVYDVYDPSSYHRTYKLIQDASFDVNDTNDGIEIINTRTDSDTGKYIVPVIESGHGYDWTTPIEGVPRPFIENTIEDLSQNKQHIKALKDSLQKKLNNKII